jgi:hypothetical protein
LKAKETLPDALLQRLMVKIQKYRIEEKNGDPVDVVKDVVRDVLDAAIDNEGATESSDVDNV